MIARVAGKLVAKDIDAIEVMTAGGVAYGLVIPLNVYESLPRVGEDVTLHTSLVVKEDSWQLFGFTSVFEKRLFEKLLTANGVGPALAIGLLSALSPTRLIRAIREKDIPTLQSVPRVGRKKAERLILDLGDKLDGLGEATGTAGAPATAAADDAMRPGVARLLDHRRRARGQSRVGCWWRRETGDRIDSVGTRQTWRTLMLARVSRRQCQGTGGLPLFQRITARMMTSAIPKIRPSLMCG